MIVITVVALVAVIALGVTATAGALAGDYLAKRRMQRLQILCFENQDDLARFAERFAEFEEVLDIVVTHPLIVSMVDEEEERRRRRKGDDRVYH